MGVGLFNETPAQHPADNGEKPDNEPANDYGTADPHAWRTRVGGLKTQNDSAM